MGIHISIVHCESDRETIRFSYNSPEDANHQIAMSEVCGYFIVEASLASYGFKVTSGGSSPVDKKIRAGYVKKYNSRLR